MAIQLRVQAVLVYARNVLFDDESDDDRDILEKIDDYAERTVPMMTDSQFKRHFRMTPETFENLLSKLSRCAEFDARNTGGYPRTILEKEAMVTIWYLGNIESFRSVADRFGISKSTCWDIVYRMCRLMLQINERFAIISWPNEQRQTITSNNFNSHNFPGVIGCIDGSHIPIMAPRENKNSYVNRKGFHSLLLQGVCDDRMLFISAYAGEPGSLHDQNVFQKSDLYAAIQQHHVTFHNDNHLLGDLAYTLSVNVMVGFKDNEHLSRRQKNFNVILSKMRVKIENVFGLLKGRF